MKRTGEIILTVLGILIYGFVAAMGFLVIWIQNNQGQIEDLLMESGSEDLITEFQWAVESIGNSGLLMIVFAAIAVIAGIISIVLVKGNKKPKAAGITLIATAVVLTIISFGVGILGGIFYVIAGILCLVRKDKTIVLEEESDPIITQ